MMNMKKKSGGVGAATLAATAAGLCFLLVTTTTMASQEGGGGPVVLTEDNFEALVVDSGKNAFVKFYAPWCGHCKAMAPAWNELGAEYAASKSVVIGDVDCTEQGDLCSEYDVSGYPTIKYFTADEPQGEKYNGGRDVASLRAFTQETLGARCTVSDAEDTCSEKEANYVKKMKGQGIEAVNTQFARLSAMKADAMTHELRTWVNQRLNILTQLKEEL